MKPTRLLFARMVRALGALMLSASTFAFVSWMQSRDPECVVEAGGALLELRLCDAVVDTAQPAPWWQLAIIAAVTLLGGLLTLWKPARCSRKRHE